MNIEKITDNLYKINAFISGTFVTGMSTPTKEDMIHLNRHLAKIIKELRKYNENQVKK